MSRREFTTAFVFGRPGSGKSALLRALVRRNARRQDAYYKFVVFDTTNEWSHVDGTLDGQVTILKSSHYTVEDAAKLCMQKAPCTLVVDEIDQFAPNRGGISEIPGFYLPHIVYRGRHYKVALICATQRPGKVHQSIFGHAGVIFAYGLTLAADIARVKREFGAEVADELAELGEHQYIRYDL